MIAVHEPTLLVGLIVSNLREVFGRANPSLSIDISTCISKILWANFLKLRISGYRSTLYRSYAEFKFILFSSWIVKITCTLALLNKPFVQTPPAASYENKVTFMIDWLEVRVFICSFCLIVFLVNKIADFSFKYCWFLGCCFGGTLLTIRWTFRCRARRCPSQR